jgi:hypothetical protein
VTHGGSEGLGEGKSGRVAASAVPHFLQNLAPGLARVLQVGQTSSSFAPHPSQNDASGGLSLLHFEQNIDYALLQVLVQGLTGNRTLNHLRAFSYVHLLAARRNSFPALFADLKGSMDLMENLDPEDARAIVDPALRRPVRPQPAPAFREGFLASQV